ncbi:hypothetical protein DFP72DRAFT_860311 [Ephemerocybe angulata]|uniref:Endonuclease/exonuclease/phosphatase domain-containing protein n=1 Tax=Ephemerocybe angulata TaxID=980116 RepID=A0A8H6LTY8_9AGAR|nr:hypothetical protein DFP72DRAFT_860311 [Tulosesus angulatus]
MENTPHIAFLAHHPTYLHIHGHCCRKACGRRTPVVPDVEWQLLSLRLDGVTGYPSDLYHLPATTSGLLAYYYMSTSKVPEVSEGCPVIRIQLWNLRGKFQQWMKCPKFVEALRCYNINIFLETMMSKDLMAAEEGIPGFRRHSIEHESPHRHLDRGVAVFVQDNIQLEKSELLSSLDVLVLDSQEMMVVAAYILPRNSPMYEGVGDPYDSLEKLLAVCGEEAKPAVIVGDLNARVGVNDLRMSDNKVVSKQGESLLDSCNKMGMQIFNGIFPNSGLSMLHSPGHRHSVVDLVIGNRSVLVVDMRIGS